MTDENCELQVQIYLQCIPMGIGLKAELIVHGKCVEKLAEFKPTAIILNPGGIKLGETETGQYQKFAGEPTIEYKEKIETTLSKFIGKGEITIDLTSDPRKRNVWIGLINIENREALEELREFLKKARATDVNDKSMYSDNIDQIRLKIENIEKRLSDLGELFNKITVLIKFVQLKTCFSISTEQEIDLEDISDLGEAISYPNIDL